MIFESGDAIGNALREAIREPLGPMGQRALEAFVRLPGIHRWRPDALLLGEISAALDVGLVAAHVSNSPAANAKLEEVSDAFVASSHTDWRNSTWSEMVVAALLAARRASVEVQPRVPGARTPDLRVRWSETSDVMVEVSRATPRRRQQAVASGLQELALVLPPGDLNCHVVCHMADAADPADQSAVLDALTRLQPGVRLDNPGRWSVVGVEIEAEISDRDLRLAHRPQWWIDDAPCAIASSVRLGQRPPPRVVLMSAIPVEPLFGTIQNKADRPQHRDGLPFVIALDATELVRPARQVETELAGFLPLWDHVSAILVVQTRFFTGHGRKGWQWTLVGNTNASVPLPRAVTQALGESGSLFVDLAIASEAGP